MRICTLHCLQLLGKGICLSPLSKLWAVDFYIYDLYQLEEIPFCSTFAKSFLMMVIDFFKCLYLIYWHDHFFFLSTCWYGILHLLIFWMLTNPAVGKDSPQYNLTLYIFSQMLQKLQSQTLSCGTSLSWSADAHPDS